MLKIALVCFISLCAGWKVSGGNLDGYYTTSQISSILQTLELNSTKAKVVSVGNTVQNRSIKAFHWENEGPSVLVVGTHHAHELISSTQVLYLLDNFLKKQSLQNLRDRLDVWFIPVLNVDGYKAIEDDYSATGRITEFRKNMKNLNCSLKLENGVDLNRNYGFKWGADNLGSSSKKCSEDYRGPSAFSEPETRAIRDLIDSRRFVMGVSYHSWGNLYIHPYGYTKTNSKELVGNHWKLYSELKNQICADCEMGTPTELLNYPANGCFMDYAHSRGLFALSVELGESFHPLSTRIKDTLDKHSEPFEFLMWRVLPFLESESAMLQMHHTGVQLNLTVYNHGLTNASDSKVQIEFSENLTLRSLNSTQEVSFKNSTKPLVLTFSQINNLSKVEIRMDLVFESAHVSSLDYNITLSPQNNQKTHSFKLEPPVESTVVWEIVTVICLVSAVAIILVILYYKSEDKVELRRPQFQGEGEVLEPEEIRPV